MPKEIDALNQLRSKPKPNIPEITEESATRYVANGSGFCPGCGSSNGFRRLANSTEVFQDDDKPKVKVFGSCTACGLDWWEIYSLSAIEPT